MRIRLSKARCAWAIQFGDTTATRCMMQPGHAGGHEAKGIKKFPYQRIKWFIGDRREFTTDKDNEYAWRMK